MVYLPRLKPHTWRCIGPNDLALTVIINPGEFQNFFPLLADKGTAATDSKEITKIMDATGMEFVGPPLSDEEVAPFLKQLV